MRRIFTIYIGFCLIIALISISTADILPNGTNTTNRNMPSETNLEVIGSMSSKQTYQLNSNSAGGHEGGFLYEGERTSSVIYKNDLVTNGGYLSQSKGLNLDEGPKIRNTYNVDGTTVSTYLTDPEKGSKMSASESVQMSNSGNWSKTNLSVRNPLVQDIIGRYVGGFNSNYAGGSDVDLTSGQVATMVKTRSVGVDSSVPAEMGYLIGIHPDLSSGMPYASGSVDTQFSYSNEEGSENTTNLSSTKEMKDETSVNGQIFTFGKSFNIVSGISTD